MPGSMPTRDQGADPLLRRGGPRARARLPAARRERCAPTCTRHNRPVALEFSERIRRIPVYPAAGGYAKQAPLALLASNESPFPPLPAVREAIERALGELNRYPDPSNSRAAHARSPSATRCPPSRIAIGNGSCDILLAAGEALLEPGAELVYAWPSFSVYPHLARRLGRARGDRPARRRTTATTCRRCCARSPSRRAW